MQARRTAATTQFLRSALIGSVVALAFLTASFPASATSGSRNSQQKAAQSAPYKGAAAKPATTLRGKQQLAKSAYRANQPAGMSCVPYARMVSGIGVAGNAWQWWDNAAGSYARGNSPEAGGVLVFRGNRAMPMGHVGVVSRVVNTREVLMDHSNWPTGQGRGSVSRNVAVIDVSDANDWSAVRVELGHGGDFGSVYPVYGFIYDRPDRGVMEASVQKPAPRLELNPAPRDLRPAAEQARQSFNEVAEAPVRRRANTRRH